MTDQSFAGLCASMQGISITRGWDCIVTMSRPKVNALLEQQYISKFEDKGFLNKIFGEVAITDDGYSMLDFTGLVLGFPRLSFENATLAKSRARLTMDVESGTVSQRLNVPGYPSRVTESFTVTPQQGFKVFMDIDLKASTGIVEEQGRVIIDLGDATNFSSNLLEEGLAQEALGRFFQRLYRSLAPETRVYDLGTLDFNDDDKLVPREFEIRTQKAPRGNDPQSANSPEGAVVLFIRTRNNPTNGSTPVDDGDFRYFIPNDVDPKTGEALYTGSLILASRVVFDWFVEPYVMDNVDNGLRFRNTSQSNDTARSLQAMAGAFPVDDVYYEWKAGIFGRGYIENSLPLSVAFSNDLAHRALRVYPDNGMLRYEWLGDQTNQFYFYEDRTFPGVDPKELYIDTFFRPTVKVNMMPSIDTEKNIVAFETQAEAVLEIYEDLYQKLQLWVGNDIATLIRARLTEPKKIIKQALEGIKTPEINVFHLNHLLFPQQNALLLTNAALPGDLFLVGHIDPKQTSFTLEPLSSRVKAGRTVQLSVKQIALQETNITWSARNINGEQVPETISQTGLFTAPDISQIKDLAERYIITASYTTDDGQLREASALVAVVAESLTVTPGIATLEFSEGKTVKLRATSLGTGALTWTLREDFGVLVPEGSNATYRLPQFPPDQAAGLVVIDVEDPATGDKATATILWLQKTFIIPVKPAYHPGLPAKASTQLRVADPAFDPNHIKWNLLAGEGQVADGGLYTAPDVITSPYAVVEATYGSAILTKRGYGIVHLSNFARASGWTELRSIKLSSNSVSPTVYSNGLQQVNVTVAVDPKDVGDEPGSISETELNSIQLLAKDENNEWQPLPRTGKSGVPEGGEWGYGIEANDYIQYPAPPVAPGRHRPTALDVGYASFYVQSRASGTLQIAASMRGDDGLTYLSTVEGDHSDPERTITLRAEDPPDFANSAYTFDVVRVAGADAGDDNNDGENDGNDRDLVTVDYYLLKLVLYDEQILIKHVEFAAAKSMVQWESRQFDEDVCSFTGYAVAGSNALNFDPLLYARMPENIKPKKELVPGKEVPNGELLISLHRCEYWNFDLGCEPDYTKGLTLIIHDVSGNRHRVRVNFKSPVNRNGLTFTKL
jgi:hypothetical protein